MDGSVKLPVLVVLQTGVVDIDKQKSVASTGSDVSADVKEKESQSGGVLLQNGLGGDDKFR